MHRQNRPQRGACNFELVVPSLYNNQTARMANEQCIMEMLTGGIAVADYDGDGLQDIFFTRYEDRSILYRNMGKRTYFF